MISTRVLAIAAITLLLLQAVALVLMEPYNRLSGRGSAALPMHKLGDTPIYQIELARNEDDLRAIFLAGDVARNLSDARAGNNLDTFLYIPAYIGFLIILGLILRRVDPKWAGILFLCAVVVAPVVAVSDWTENFGIARALDHFERDGGPHLGDAMRIATPSIIKWTLVTAVLLVYGVCAIRKPRLWRIAVAVLTLGLGGSFAVMLARYAAVRLGGL